MSFNSKKKPDSQLSGFVIAAVIVGCLYIFFYQKDNQPEKVQNIQFADEQNSQPNALENFEKDELRRKEETRINAQPFLAKVMLRYSDDGSVKGPMQLTSSNKKDAIFIVRNKLNNAIMAIVQVPRGHSEKIEMPVGEYFIEYAQGDGVWQGLGKFWGYSTNFNKSRHNHSVYQEIIPNGTRIHGTGIILDVEDGTASEDISKKQFVSD